MALSEKRLSSLMDIQNSDLSLNHNLLKDRVANTLRDHISSGFIPEGTKLTEREVSTMLGISRAPARDALMALETEGLVVSRGNGRYVIELTEKDVRDIHAVRWTLEKLATELAAQNVTEADHAILYDLLRELEEPAAGSDAHLWTQRDMALHRAIWQLSDNPHLLKVLDSVFGSIFVMAERNKMFGKTNIEGAIKQHRELVELIIAGDSKKAGEAMEAHLKRSLASTLKTFRIPENADVSNLS